MNSDINLPKMSPLRKMVSLPDPQPGAEYTFEVPYAQLRKLSKGIIYL